jgi:hypothetical protein
MSDIMRKPNSEPIDVMTKSGNVYAHKNKDLLKILEGMFK